MTKRQREALRMIGHGILMLADADADESARPPSEEKASPPRQPTRDKLRGVVPSDLDRQRARLLMPKDES